MVSFEPVPALLMRISAPPSCAAAVTTLAQPSAVATSAATPCASTWYFAPIRDASACNRCEPRAVISTLAPSAANPSATARPMPTLPPVMTASLPFSPRSISGVFHQDLQLHVRRPSFDRPVESLDRVLELECLGDQRLQVDAAGSHESDGSVVLVGIAEH